MKNQAQKLTSIAVTIALLLVGGIIIYSSSYLLGGAQIFKIVFMALYFSILLYLLTLRCNDLGTLTLLSIVLGLILIIISPLMTLAIVLAGLFTDLTSYFLFRGYGEGRKRIFSIAFYSSYSIIFSLLVTSALLTRFTSITIIVSIYVISGLVAYILGMIGTYLGYHLNNKYIHMEKKINISQ